MRNTEVKLAYREFTAPVSYTVVSTANMRGVLSWCTKIELISQFCFKVQCAMRLFLIEIIRVY
jgi:hypothetical protein